MTYVDAFDDWTAFESHSLEQVESPPDCEEVVEAAARSEELTVTTNSDEIVMSPASSDEAVTVAVSSEKDRAQLSPDYVAAAEKNDTCEATR